MSKTETKKRGPSNFAGWPEDSGKFWTISMVERGKALYADGASAQEIYEALGAESRNAVCGAIARYKFERGVNYSEHENRAAAMRQASAARAAKRAAEPKADKPAGGQQKRRGAPKFGAVDFRRPAADGTLPPIAEATDHDEDLSFEVPIKQRKTLLQLNNNHCRWPYGDPLTVEFYYCGGDGADLVGGVPYCPGHTILSKPKSNRG